MSTENLLWGAPRIDGGLLKLGFDRFVGAGKQRRRDDRMRRRSPPSARPSVMSAAIFETGSKATTTPVAPAVPRVFAFSMQAEQSIVVDPKSPGGINSPHGLILFDGVCVLCSRGCRFVSKRDRRGYFRFVPIQLAEGRPLAEQLGIDPDHPGSFWRAARPM